MIVATPPAADVAHTIIVVTYGRPDLLCECLCALENADVPAWGWEVLVVDNSEPDCAARNRDVVASLEDPRFAYQSMAPIGSTAARHRGVELARGEVISFLDDDSLVAQSWLLGVEEAFACSSPALVGGPVAPVYACEPPAWLEYFWEVKDGVKYHEYVSLVDGGSDSREMDTTLVFGCNMTTTKAMFLAAGGLDPDLMPPHLFLFQGGAETALSLRIAAMGHRAVYAPRCAIGHIVSRERMTPAYFQRRATTAGIKASFLAIRSSHGMRPEQGVLASAVPNWHPRSLRSRMRSRLSALRRRMREPSEVRRIRARVARARAAGWALHHNAAVADPLLLEYVLRDDYLGDRAFPPGWSQHGRTS
jgi:glycosyltransferase involved in cell wall biosynthesis